MIIGLCHGVFDILHFGHVRHFLAARNRCDRLVVSVTSDRFVNKGPGRPIFSVDQRIEVIKAIRFIDEVVCSDFENGLLSLQRIRPRIYFKDAEYRGSKHPGFMLEEQFCVVNDIQIFFTEEDRSSSTEALRRLRGGGNG